MARGSAHVEWAVHACLVLASAPAGSAVTARRLAALFDLPGAYFAKMLTRLAAAGLVEPVEGRGGGYRIGRRGRDTTVGAIVRAVRDRPPFGCTEIRRRGPFGAPAEACTRPCEVAAALYRADRRYLDALDDVRLADLASFGPDHPAYPWLTGDP